MKVTIEGLKKIETTIGFDSLEFDTSVATREVRFISGGTCVAKIPIPFHSARATYFAWTGSTAKPV